jgi:hypothetical protein
LHFLALDERRQRLESSARKIYYWISPLDPLKADLLQKLQLAIDSGAVPLVQSHSLAVNHAEWSALQEEIHCGPTAADLLERLNRHDTRLEDRDALREKLNLLRTRALIDRPANVMNRLYRQMLAR